MSDIFEKIKKVIEFTEEDVVKFYEKNNKTAGTRVRKAMQEVKLFAQELRKDINQRKHKI